MVYAEAHDAASRQPLPVELPPLELPEAAPVEPPVAEPVVAMTPPLVPLPELPPEPLLPHPDAAATASSTSAPVHRRFVSRPLNWCSSVGLDCLFQQPHVTALAAVPGRERHPRIRLPFPGKPLSETAGAPPWQRTGPQPFYLPPPPIGTAPETGAARGLPAACGVTVAVENRQPIQAALPPTPPTDPRSGTR